jgi:hypothetical protein
MYALEYVWIAIKFDVYICTSSVYGFPQLYALLLTESLLRLNCPAAYLFTIIYKNFEAIWNNIRLKPRKSYKRSKMICVSIQQSIVGGLE